MSTWIDIPGWETRYQITENGEVRSKNMTVGAKGGVTASRKGRVLTPVVKSNGYLCVTLTDGVNRPQIGLHRLVARAFIGECPIGLNVLHNDGNKLNNCRENLRYGTQADNHMDTLRHGHRLMGEKHPLSKLCEVDVHYIRVSTDKGVDLANAFNVTPAHISAVRHRKCWVHI
jgi:hypothetical protein